VSRERSGGRARRVEPRADRAGQPGRRGLLRVVPALAALGVIGGCTVLENTAPRFDFFVIEDLRLPSPAGPRPQRLDRTLLLTIGPAQALYDSDRIVYTRDGPTRSYYQYSNWSERPTRRIVALAESRLAAVGGFRSVAQTVAGIRGDLILTLRLDELFHDDSVTPGQLRLGLTAELVDWRTRTLTGRAAFREAAPVATRDARGAARAANVAVTAALDALAAWLEAATGSPA